MLITEDASVDARFSANPYVAGEPYIKFYAGDVSIQGTLQSERLCASANTEAPDGTQRRVAAQAR